MKKVYKIILIIIGVIILLTVIDLISIFKFNKPIFAIKESPNKYSGIFYDSYDCMEFSIIQIKLKGIKYSCAVNRLELGKVINIVDKTKNKKDFSCAEALEKFYEDDKYEYFFDCIKGKYIVVKYESGFEEIVADALKNGTIKISDLDKYNIDYIRYNK